MQSIIFKKYFFCGNFKNAAYRFLFLFVICCPLGCKKFVDVGLPQTQLISASVFENDGNATSAINGIYSKMMGDNSFAAGAIGSVTYLTALSSDELINYFSIPSTVQFYNDAVDKTNAFISSYLWGTPYQYIFASNLIIEGLNNSTGVTGATKKQITGEALFVRAFCNFYLVNLFGDIPLITSSDYKANAIALRTPKADVYKQIIEDLKNAQNMLADDYSFSSGSRVRPNKWAAIALLARVYLYTADWADAETETTSIINNPQYSLLSDLNKVFLANSNEAIWQLMPVLPGKNTNDAGYFISASTPFFVSLYSKFDSSFESGDLRSTSWILTVIANGKAYYYPFKYKVKNSTSVTEYEMVLRLSEQYLIRAEARLQQGNLTGAADDLNVIRKRAGLPNTPANTSSSLFAAIQTERQHELFTEWGHRWLDLKRWNLCDSILGPLKQSWKSSDTLYPIPQSEIQADANLRQNPGY